MAFLHACILLFYLNGMWSTHLPTPFFLAIPLLEFIIWLTGEVLLCNMSAVKMCKGCYCRLHDCCSYSIMHFGVHIFTCTCTCTCILSLIWDTFQPNNGSHYEPGSSWSLWAKLVCVGVAVIPEGTCTCIWPWHGLWTLSIALCEPVFYTWIFPSIYCVPQNVHIGGAVVLHNQCSHCIYPSCSTQFTQQYHHYQSLLQLLFLSPSQETPQLSEIIMFLSQVPTCTYVQCSCTIYLYTYT